MRKALRVSFGVISVTEGVLGSKEVDGPNAVATLDKKEIFLAGARWRIKASKITNLSVSGRSMTIQTDRFEAKLEGALHLGPWEEFCGRVEGLYDRYRVPEAPAVSKRPKTAPRSNSRRAFGTGARRALTTKALENFDDDFDDDPKPSTANHKSPPKDDSDLEEVEVEGDEKSVGLDEETPPKQELPRKVTTSKKRERGFGEGDIDSAVGTRIPLTQSSKKGRLRKMASKNDEESDDEFSFDDDVKMTTPAAQRFVSPGANTSTPRDEAEEEAAEEEYVVPPDQTRISSFFAPKPTKPKPTVPDSPRTPSRPNHMSPAAARLVRASQQKRKTLQQTSWLDRSPARIDSAEKQRSLLFGSRPFTEEKKDSGTTDEDPPSVRRVVVRPTLKPRTRGLPLSPARRRFLREELAPSRPFLGTRPARGLRNLGNTCYLNASLQLLYTLSGFTESLQGTGGPLTKSLASVAEELKKGERFVSANPRAVKEAMDAKTDKFSGYEQRDAHEFVGDLIDYVHEELQEEKAQSSQEDDKKALPTDDFLLTVNVCLTCQSCGYTRSKEELYRHLSIDVVADDSGADSAPLPVASIEKGLARFFEPETRELKCEKCKEGTHASQTSQITARPKALLLHLKRFVVEEKPVATPNPPSDENSHPNSPSKVPATEYVFRKNKNPVAIPENLTLEAFEETQSAGPSYSLKSVVHHIGQRQSSGHYTADALRLVKPASGEGDKEPTWVSFDDASSARTTLDEIRSNPNKQRTVYMLLYTLPDTEG